MLGNKIDFCFRGWSRKTSARGTSEFFRIRLRRRDELVGFSV